MTQALFIETAKAEEAMKQEGTRRLNVSRVLSVLGVSRNGYYAFKKRKPSNNQLKKEDRMKKIREIHEDSHPN